jgi:hypothetical protein
MKPIKSLKDPFDHEHYVSDSFDIGYTMRQGPAGILLLMTLAYFIYLVGGRQLKWFLKKCCGSNIDKLYPKEIIIDEDIGTF